MSPSASKSKVASKPVSDSRVEMTEIVLPNHTNQLGTIFGGQLVAWIDIAASIAASRHSRTVCVTASIDTMHFVAPVRVGQIVSLYGSVNFTGRTSMEIGVRVDSEDPRSGHISHVATAYLTFVSVDQNGNPISVPQVTPETPEEKRRFRDAEMRRQARLALKKELELKRKSDS